MCTTCVPVPGEVQGGRQIPLEQELHVVMSYHVGARDQIRVLYQS